MAAETGPGRRFVGRTETVEALHRGLEEARAGSGGVTLLVGETGVGKSTLVEELLREVRGQGISVLIGRAPALDDPPPFALIRSAIEGGENPPAPTAERGLRSLPEIAPVGAASPPGEAPVPSLVSFEQRLVDTLARSEDRDARSRERILDGIAEQVFAFARRGPTVLLLEDLHRADDSSLAAVEFFVHRLEHEPLWVLATCRPYVSLADAGRARLERFEQATRARQLVLPPLTSEEIGEYLRLTEPSRSFSPDEVARRFSESGGNPLRLGQMVQRPEVVGRAPEAALPPPPTLDPEGQRVLEVASVLGTEFRYDLLLRVSGEQDEERFEELVDDLVRRGLLFERSGEVLAFPADRVREQTYGRLSEARRRILHWSAGETLEATGRAGVATTYALARHFYLGQVGGKSVKYNRLAAEIADRALAPDVARTHLLHALESHRQFDAGNIESESELVLELARVSEELGRLTEAESTLTEFLDREQNDPRLSTRRRATLEIFLCIVLASRGNLAGVSELAQKVLDTPGLDDQLLIRVGAHHHLGFTLYYLGRYAEALVHHTEELRLARKVGNDLVTLRAQIWRVADLAMMGPTEEAVSEARQLTVARDRLGSPRESAQAHLFLGDLLADARCTPAQRKEALSEYARSVEFAEMAQDPRRVGWAHYKTGELLRELGPADKAEESLESACHIFEQVGDQVGLSMAVKVRGQIAMDRGALDVAERELLESHRLLRGLHHTLEETDVILQLARLADLRGDGANARRHLQELERLKLPAIRPDLVPEFEKLKRDLGAKEGTRAPS